MKQMKGGRKMEENKITDKQKDKVWRLCELNGYTWKECEDIKALTCVHSRKEASLLIRMLSRRAKEIQRTQNKVRELFDSERSKSVFDLPDENTTKDLEEAQANFPNLKWQEPDYYEAFADEEIAAELKGQQMKRGAELQADELQDHLKALNYEK